MQCLRLVAVMVSAAVSAVEAVAEAVLVAVAMGDAVHPLVAAWLLHKWLKGLLWSYAMFAACGCSGGSSGCHSICCGNC